MINELSLWMNLKEKAITYDCLWMKMKEND